MAKELKMLGTKAMEKEWEISQATITCLCREGKVPGAEQDSPGSPWRIPEGTPRPAGVRPRKHSWLY